MVPITVGLTGWRNAPFPPDEYVCTDDDGAVIPLTDRTFAMDVRAIPGEGPALISLETAASSSADGVRVLDAPAGVFRIQIGQASMQAAWDAAYAAGMMKAGEAVTLVYDLLVFDEGYPEAWFEGSFTINPGVTV